MGDSCKIKKMIVTIQENGIIRMENGYILGRTVDSAPEFEELKPPTGKEIGDLFCDWADQNRIHPDDFDGWFVPELLERLDEDGNRED